MLKVRFFKLKRLFLSTLFITIPLNTTSAFANEFLKQNIESNLIAETKEYREHKDESEDEFESILSKIIPSDWAPPAEEITTGGDGYSYWEDENGQWWVQMPDGEWNEWND